MKNLYLLILISIIYFFSYSCGGEEKKIISSNIKEEIKTIKNLEGMAFIKGGKFNYHGEGSHEDQPGNKTIFIKDFYMDKTEVTVAQYRKVMGNLPTNTHNWTWRDNHPVVYVSWNKAKTYCKKIGKRLPSEDEWEYASGGPQHTTFPNGEQFNCKEYCCSISPCQQNSTCPVGSYNANGYGLYDMGGSVWEWTDSMYGSSEKSGAFRGSEKSHVLRGGSWDDFGENSVKSGFRFIYIPDSITESSGFRCVK